MRQAPLQKQLQNAVVRARCNSPLLFTLHFQLFTVVLTRASRFSKYQEKRFLVKLHRSMPKHDFPNDTNAEIEYDDFDEPLIEDQNEAQIEEFFSDAPDESWIIFDSASSPAVRALLTEIGAKPSKTLGQNFLVKPDVLDRIVETANVTKEDRVLEIGSGLGALSSRLARAAAEVVAVEKDPRMCEVLGRHFRAPNFRQLCDDALEIEYSLLGLPDANVKVVANLPYGISKPILRRLMEEWRPHFSSLTLMVQREVADRILAKHSTSEYGPLAIMTQLHSNAKRAFDVKAGSFVPPPNVLSSVVHIELLQTPNVELRDEKFFWRIVRAAFAQRRKQLTNTLRAVVSDGEQLARAFETTNIDPKRRGETLSLQEFADLSHALL